MMTLFSNPKDLHSHRVRFVLAEKDVALDIVDVEPAEFPKKLLAANPYQSLPMLVERDLVLYESRIVLDYLDERYPHPPLMPIDPITRARFRMTVYRLERDWYGLAADIEQSTDKRAEAARNAMRDLLLSNMDAFAEQPYFQSADFSIIDATLAPLLWRLPSWGIKLPTDKAAPMLQYERRVCLRPAFRQSLSKAERALRA